MLNFIAIDLQLYKIYKIARVLFFGTQRTNPSHLRTAGTLQTWIMGQFFYSAWFSFFINFSFRSVW